LPGIKKHLDTWFGVGILIDMRTTNEWQISYCESAKLHLSTLPPSARRDVVARLGLLAEVGERAFANCLVATRPGRPDVHALDLGGRYALVVRHARGLSVQAVLDGRSLGAFCRVVVAAERETDGFCPVVPADSSSVRTSSYQLQ
jgi:hypothetical protein